MFGETYLNVLYFLGCQKTDFTQIYRFVSYSRVSFHISSVPVFSKMVFFTESRKQKPGSNDHGQMGWTEVSCKKSNWSKKKAVELNMIFFFALLSCTEVQGFRVSQIIHIWEMVG